MYNMCHAGCHFYPVHGAESAYNVVPLTFPEGQGSLSLNLFAETVRFCKRKSPVLSYLRHLFGL